MYFFVIFGRVLFINHPPFLLATFDWLYSNQSLDGKQFDFIYLRSLKILKHIQFSGE